MNILQTSVDDTDNDNHSEFIQYVITQVLFDTTRSYIGYCSEIRKNSNFVIDENVDVKTRGIYYYLLATKAFSSMQYIDCVNYANNAIVNECMDGYYILGHYYYQIENNIEHGKNLFKIGHENYNIACTLLYLEILFNENKSLQVCLNLLNTRQYFERYIFMLLHKQYFEGINGLLTMNDKEYRYEVKLAIAKYYMYIERNGPKAIEYLKPLYKNKKLQIHRLRIYDNDEWQGFYDRIENIFYNSKEINYIENTINNYDIIRNVKKYFNM